MKNTIKISILLILTLGILLWFVDTALGTVIYPAQKYATQTTIYFVVYDSNSPWRNYETAPALADVHVFQNGASEARAENAVTDLGRSFSLVLSATEMTAAYVTVDINDISEPPLFGDETIIIPTYGNASAAYQQDYSDSIPAVDVTTWNGTSVAAPNTAGYPVVTIKDGTGTGEIDTASGIAKANVVQVGSAAIPVATATFFSDAVSEPIEANVTQWNGSAVAAPATAGYPAVTIKDGTGTGELDTSSGTVITGSLSIGAINQIEDDPINANNIRHSMAWYIKRGAGGYQTSIYDGTVSSATSNTLVMAAGSSTTNDVYNGNMLAITAGTGVGQTRIIVDYVGGTTRTATLDKAWATNPTAGSTFSILASAGSYYADEGTAQSADNGATPYIQLAATASATNDTYNGSWVTILSGTGSGQTRTITDYTGITTTALVDTAWGVIPNATSVYAVIPNSNLASDIIPPDAGLTIEDILSALTTQGYTTTRSGYLDYLADGTYGLSALNTDIDSVISSLGNATYGLSALQTEIAAISGAYDTTDLMTWIKKVYYNLP